MLGASGIEGSEIGEGRLPRRVFFFFGFFRLGGFFCFLFLVFWDWIWFFGRFALYHCRLALLSICLYVVVLGRQLFYFPTLVFTE